jgi:HD-GYP domain-containing protein (c-di-GMP phosphodiesterase class II)
MMHEAVYFFFGVVFLLLFLRIEFMRRKQKADEKSYNAKIEELKNNLGESSADLDNLLTTLLRLHEFGVSVTGIVKKEELVESVVNMACDLISSESASLMLIDKSNNELYIVAAKGLPKDVMRAVKIKIGEGISGKVVRTGKPIFTESMESDIKFFKPDFAKRDKSKSFVCLPLLVKNKVIGVLNVNTAQEIKSFEDRDMRLLSILADQAAVTLDNVELYNHLQNFYFEIINALARAIDAKDSYTHDHADRARHYAKRIAESMHLPNVITRHIEFAALMHDIGKIGIEEAILRKPAKLTPVEFEIMKKHPVIGNNIISPITFLAPVAPMVLYHQECYDGSGYPEGLVGEEIPLGSRIVAVIDSYDAITSDRPYRKALPKDYAISELQKGAGTQFDPGVVTAFVNILKDESANRVS